MSSPSLFVSPHVTPEPGEQKTIGLQLWYDLYHSKEFEPGCGPWELAIPPARDLQKCILGPCAHHHAAEGSGWTSILEHARYFIPEFFTLNFQQNKLILGFANEGDLRFSSINLGYKVALHQAWDAVGIWYGCIIRHGDISLCEVMGRSTRYQLQSVEAQPSHTDKFVTEAKAYTKLKRDVEEERERFRSTQKHVLESRDQLEKDDKALKDQFKKDEDALRARRQQLNLAELRLKEDEDRLFKREVEVKESEKRADDAEERALPGSASRKRGQNGKLRWDSSSIDLTSDGEESTTRTSKRKTTAQRNTVT